TSTMALGASLDPELAESPALAIAHSYPGQPIALVIDQLDCVSATSGRHPDFFDTVASLVDEVRGLRGRQLIHLVLACRKFDLDNDHRFRVLTKKEEPIVPVPSLTAKDVDHVLRSVGGDPGRLTTGQRKLLELPQNLSLFVDSALANDLSPTFVSQKGLFDLYWEAK